MADTSNLLPPMGGLEGGLSNLTSPWRGCKKGLFILLFPISTIAAGQTKSGDTHNGVSLDSVVVYGRTKGTMLRTDNQGAMLWNMSMMNELPKIMGNADPLHYAQMLPGVTTNGEYDAGLHIMGCETSHNYISIDGVPLYGVAHLLGIFSVFNASHFKQMVLRKTLARGASPNSLGAEVDMQTFYQPTDSVTGEMAVGLMSSQGTLRLPVTQKSELTLSIRGSYLNLLYSGLLKGDESTLKYSFYDANVTYNHILNDRNRLRFNFYTGKDDATMKQADMAADIMLKWKNMMASMTWTYDNGTLLMSDRAYYTRTASQGEMNMTGLGTNLPASLHEMGNKLSLTWKSWTFGFDMATYSFHPQSPEVSSEFIHIERRDEKNRSTLFALYADKEWELTSRLTATTGMRGSLYHVEGKNYRHLSPAIGLTYRHNENFDISLAYAYQHQYLTKTGMSNINTPLEFWLSAGTYGLEPQTAHSLNLSTRLTSPNGTYTATMEAYEKWLTNQTEYNGTIYSFVATNYDLQSLLLNGRGHNYGINVMLAKNRGWITGWVTYAYSRARRTFNTASLMGTFPSSHERLHEVNGVITFHLGKRWDVGITGVWATGTPFTAPKLYYLLNGQLIAEFAEHNANRLKPYYRIDGSINYHLHPTRSIHEQGLNLSVYNMTANNHDLFYYMKANAEGFHYKSMKFFMRVLPSISYYMKF